MEEKAKKKGSEWIEKQQCNIAQEASPSQIHNKTYGQLTVCSLLPINLGNRSNSWKWKIHIRPNLPQQSALRLEVQMSQAARKLLGQIQARAELKLKYYWPMAREP